MISFYIYNKQKRRFTHLTEIVSKIHNINKTEKTHKFTTKERAKEREKDQTNKKKQQQTKKPKKSIKDKHTCFTLVDSSCNVLHNKPMSRFFVSFLYLCVIKMHAYINLFGSGNIRKTQTQTTI